MLSLRIVVKRIFRFVHYITDQHNEETDINGVGELAYGKSLGIAMNGAEFCRDEVICPATVDYAPVTSKIINVSS